MKLSGYTYVKNAVEMNYPFKESIQSMLDCCDEVVVIDASNKQDGTQDILSDLVKNNEQKLDVYEYEVDWSAPNFGIWDGKLKAIARNQCSGDYLMQMDTDEIIEENARPKIEKLLAHLNWLNDPSPPLVAMPVVEYWGSSGKVRVDVNPWKWRISKNDSNITHGIPASLRKLDNGLLYAQHGTDGCDYIYSDSGLIVPCANFVNADVEELRRSAVSLDSSRETYEKWFNVVVDELPTIYHFSWWSVYRKIKGYDMFWNTFWPSLYNEQKPHGTNPFFSTSIEEHSEEEIISLAKKLESETGGHIFHTPWSGNKTNSVQINKPLPKLIENWCRENKTK